MLMFKCELCGELIGPNDVKKIRQVRLSQYREIRDSKPLYDKKYDVCTSCIEKIFGKDAIKDDQGTGNNPDGGSHKK